MSFFWKGRLEDKPSDLLKYYYADTMRHDGFLDALHQWDKAQVVVLAEQKFATPEVVRGLVVAMASLEREGVVETRRDLWNVIHGGEEYMRRHCDEEISGWLHLGRSSPSLRVVASRIAFRDLQLRIMAATLSLREQFIEVAAEHVDTVMPGYSYIQHIEPTTFGFYLMSFVESLERDFGRLRNCYTNTNISSVGTGAAYGIEYPLDLERFDALLGFDAAPWNARDSIRNYDYLIETYMALALLHSTLGRVAMDFLIWHTSEFNFIRIPDRLSITSSISPQMRIPYVLEFIHGTSGLLAGRLMEALAVTKTASDQLEMATLLPAEFWQCADESVRAIEALIDTLDGLEVNKEQMEKTANAHWAQASTLIGYFVKEKNLSYRTGHQVLALLMKTIADGRFAVSDVTADMVEQAAETYLGRRLGITQDVLDRVFDARYCVDQRHYRGGTAPVRVREHIEAARQRLVDERAEVKILSSQVRASRDLLDSAFVKIQEQYS
jgi:argininosuccinate lyase